MANAQTFQLHLKAIGDFSDVTNNVSQVQRALGQLKLPPALKKSFESTFQELSKETAKYQQLLGSGFKKKGDITGLESSGDKINKLLSTLKSNMAKIDPSILQQSFKIDPSAIEKLTAKMKELKGQLTGKLNSDEFKVLKAEADGAAQAISKISKTKFTSNFSEAFNRGDIDGAAEAIRQLELNHKQFNNAAKEKTFQQSLAAMKTALDRLRGDGQIQNITSQINDLDSRIKNIDASELQRFIQAFSNGRGAVDGMTREVGEFTAKTQQAARSQMSLGSQIDQLKNRVSYFFGLTNAVYLFRNAIRSALQTVKELDETMTQTAVVTDMSVGDMWEKLPVYTERANALGVAVKDLYQATTLYYQQGLKGQEVMEVGAETMKMAAIAGMEAEESTQAMTAALRGFNMEVTQANAQTVNDVYSRLAAITASDTGQIATAMTKTASIASNANMEFERTAALLAQIIETTQEAPETAGTALKTIIARFSEVKELKSQGKMSGQDEEGESIDVNKISAALNSVGISMNSFFAGTEGLDSVLLRLAEKWDTLDFATQRYIATTAAGSRQQSRFIAMMSDYKRSIELVGAAEGSAGASQEQWSKTTESLQYKINQLKNAWNQFLMSIANNQIIKAGVSILRGLLDTINSITGSLPGFASGLANLLITFVALQAGGKVISALFTTLAAKFAAGGKAAGVSFRTALAKEFSKTQGIFTKAAWKIPAINTRSQVASMNQLTAAYGKSQRAQKVYTNSVKNSIGTQKAQDALRSHAIATEAAYNAQLAKTSAELGLNTSQQAAFSAMVGAGVGVETAATAAKSGVTAATYNQMAATVAAMGLGEAESKQKLEQMINTYALISAKELENATDKLSLTQKLGLIAVAMFGSKAQKEELRTRWQGVAAKLAESGATWTLTIANWALQTSMIVILAVVIAIIAAIALLVILIVALVRAAKNNTPEAKMKRLKEEAEAAAKAAEKAQEAYEEFLESKKKYKELVDTLESLTEGTEEWKDALQDVNDQVLDLIQTYPILADYVKPVGENGQWEITDEGFLKTEQLLEANKRNTAVAANLANIKVIKTQFKQGLQNDDLVAFGGYSVLAGDRDSTEVNLSGSRAKNLLEAIERLTPEQRARTGAKDEHDYTTRLQGYSYTDRGRTYVDDDVYSRWNLFGEATESDMKYIYSDKFIEIANVYGMTANELYENYDELKEYVNSYNTQMKALAYSSMSSSAFGSEYSTGIQEGLVNTLGVESIRNKADDAWEQDDWMIDDDKEKRYWRNKRNKTTDDLQEKINDYQIETGVQIDTTGKEDHDLIAYYNAISGEDIDIDEFIEEHGRHTDKEIIKKIKNLEAAQEITKISDELYNLAITDETAGDILSRDLDIQVPTNYLENLKDVSKEAKAVLADQFETIKTMRKDINLEVAKIFKIEDETEKNNAAKNYFNSYKQAKKYVDIYKAIAEQTSEGANIFSEMFNKFQQEENGALLQEFENIKWESSIDAAAKLKKLYFEGSDAAKDYVSELKKLAPAALSATAQVNELYGVIGAEKLADLAKDGEITATEIIGLKDDCEQLRTVMDTTGVSANTMAAYFEKLQKGTINMVSAGSNFIDVLDKLKAAENTIQDAFGFIDTFEAERSSTEIGTYFQEMQTKIQELFDKGAYSDSQLSDYIEAFIGEENWGDIIKEKGGDMKAALIEVMSSLPKNGTNMYQLWKQFAETDTSGMATLGEKGEINYDLEKIVNVDTLKKQLQGTLGISEALADAMIGDAQTFTSDFKAKLNNLSLRDALSNWLLNAVEYEGTKIISQDQLNAFAEEAGLTPGALKTALEDQGYKVASFLNKDGALAEEMRQQIVNTINSGNTFDLNSTYQMLLEVGLDDEAAQEELKKMARLLVGMPVSIGDEPLGELESTMKITGKNATIDSIIEGLGDEKVEAARELDALQQEKLMASAMSAGLIAAAGAPLQAIASGMQTIVNGGIDKVNKLLPEGKKISHVDYVGGVKSKVSGLIDTAGTDIDDKYDPLINKLQTKLNTLQEESGKEYSTAAEEMLSKILKFLGVNEDKNASGYDDENQRTDEESTDTNTQKWKNDYDKYYNNARKINAELRKREQLENEYERILNKNNTTAEALIENQRAQLASLEEEKKMREKMIDDRMSYIDEIQNEYADVGQYAYFDKTLGKVQINYDELEALEGSEDSDKTKRVQDYISALEDQEGLLEDEVDALNDIEDKVWKIYQEGKEEYLDLENRVKEALISSRQDEIDKLSNINESITELNSSLIDALQKQVDDYRQIRDNEQTEQDLADKQRRLAYLQQDTSGAYQAEISKLQKEIDDETMSYTDNLVDQKIAALQDENDLAAKQRQRQIDIMNAQLEQYSNSGKVWADVQKIIESSMGPNGVRIDSSLWTLLKESEDYASMSHLQKLDWGEKLCDTVAQAYMWLVSGGNSIKGQLVTGQLAAGNTIEFTTKDDQTLTGTVQSDGTIAASGRLYNSVYQNGAGKYVTTEKKEDGVIDPNSPGYALGQAIAYQGKLVVDAASYAAGTLSSLPHLERGQGLTGEKNIKHLQRGLNALIEDGKLGDIPKVAVNGDRRDKNTMNAVKKLQIIIGESPADGLWGGETEYWFKNGNHNLKKYKSGGLASFTGPAWLDGTKARPEYVLNSEQTKAFLTLVDVLADLKTPASSISTENRGDNVYDIDINVESIGDDYSVEQMAQIIKRLITDDATYRNTNAINLVR